jgi:hypothetical protein
MTQTLTQALQLLTVLAVGFGLMCYGILKGRKERLEERQRVTDPRQQSLFPQREQNPHAGELIGTR